MTRSYRPSRAAFVPQLDAALFAAGLLAAPLVICGVLKISYDLAIWQAFRKQRLVD